MGREKRISEKIGRAYLIILSNFVFHFSQWGISLMSPLFGAGTLKGEKSEDLEYLAVINYEILEYLAAINYEDLEIMRIFAALNY